PCVAACHAVVAAVVAAVCILPNMAAHAALSDLMPPASVPKATTGCTHTKHIRLDHCINCDAAGLASCRAGGAQSR
ncbi:hypothetical protein COO60DRAFT_1516357, partial [Scenedesmus sp. NREL 46B-D3]